MKMMIISLGELMTAVKSARKEKRATSIGFHGNIVEVSLCYQDDDDHHHDYHDHDDDHHDDDHHGRLSICRCSQTKSTATS